MKADIQALATLAVLLVVLAVIGWAGLRLWNHGYDTGTVIQASLDYERMAEWCQTGEVFVIEETRYLCSTAWTP